MTVSTIDEGFPLDDFLAEPLVARVAAAGPTIFPVWFLWEDASFWWLTGEWSRLPRILARDPAVALAVDTCELESGRVLQVIARGDAELMPFERDRARRILARYLGPNEDAWDPERFVAGTLESSTTRFVRLRPLDLRARDLSYRRPRAGQGRLTSAE